ncbi:putative RNA methyltransferase [Cytobacillus firmus]|uniref:putative RNA methyltransferase n=1 Tax=Cytobacillus firmus TaxID=1399 RepID=UPI0022283571|nr:methyltransferase domain-containing protein [Cytobacillus firmus]
MVNQKIAAKFKTFSTSLRCPLCKESLELVQYKSLLCSNRHTYDISKHGYVNMLNHSAKSRYSKTLYKAREKIIMESELFDPLHDKISAVIHDYFANSSTTSLMLDAGCGEGSHLKKILEQSRIGTMTGVGVDISKAAIEQAAKNYKDEIWLVGDLARSPLADQSFKMILNLFSPSNYKEFKRILSSKGLIIKVVPRSGHLKEMRKSLYGSNEKSFYKNDEIVSLFRKHFTLTDTIHVTDVRKMDESKLPYLAQMSPLSWDSNQAAIHSFISRNSSHVTIDADILIGINK